MNPRSFTARDPRLYEADTRVLRAPEGLPGRGREGSVVIQIGTAGMKSPTRTGAVRTEKT